MPSDMHPLVKFLGSLRLAVFLIGGLVFILIASTLTESHYGTPTAQKMFYEAGWFDFFLGLLAVNIFSSTLTRWPFQKKHTGFIITHAGILMLLAGSFLSRLVGVEGQLPLYEGEKNAFILQSTYEIVVHHHGGASVKADLRDRLGPQKIDLSGIEKGLALSIEEVAQNARKDWRIEDGGADSPPNAAIRLTLESERVGAHETFWLIEKNEADPSSFKKDLGPAHILLKRKTDDSRSKNLGGGPTLFIRAGASTEEILVDLSKIPKDDVLLEKGKFRLSGLRYYPDARVDEKNRLVNASDKASNPAVEFDLTGPDGKKQHVVHFSLFPDFESMHERASEKAAKPVMRLEMPGAEPDVPTPSLVFYMDGSAWTYVSRSSKTTTEGVLSPGKTFETGWMDFRFKPEQMLSRAVARQTVEPLKEGKGELAVRVNLLKDGRTVWENWLLEAEPQSLGIERQDTVLVMRRKSVPLPFSLTLKDFRKVDYPGTPNPMSFESDVLLEDEKERTAIQKTISMNKPLDYKGYRVFQSSYIQTPSEEASVFTIAKNPGIWLIYGGAIVMFLGVFAVFFVKPFSSLKKH